MEPPFDALIPYDDHNLELERNVHPQSWINPIPQQPYHLVVIGAGTAGLVTAAGAAGLGARVALVERELMGGDCLNVGCVPSKAIIHASRVAATVRDARDLGIDTAAHTVDFSSVMKRMRRLRAQISPADSARRFADLGVDVYFGQASFCEAASRSDSTINVTARDGTQQKLEYRKAVVATGARARAPNIPGLSDVNYLTNESLFSLTELPEKLGVIGSGPIGSEMAQAFARLGSRVYLFERSAQILPREDRDAAAILQQEFERDGIHLQLNCDELRVGTGTHGKITIATRRDGLTEQTEVNQLLVAAGRAPNVEELNLDAVHVKHGHGGIEVNDHLQTSNPRVYAAGDVCSKYKFTHAADFMARIVIQNTLFAIGPLGRKKASELTIPWATFTTPEVAHVGLYEDEAKRRGLAFDTYTQSLAHVDRAILDGQDQGFVKVLTRKGTDRILGATIVAANAGELISEMTLAIDSGKGLSSLASTIHPYPTQADAMRKLGDQYNRTRLTATNRRVLGLLRRWNVGR